MGLLAPLLYKATHKVFGVFFQYVVDLVEQRIDVVGQFLVAFLHLVGGGRLDLLDLLRLAGRALLPAAGVLRRHRRLRLVVRAWSDPIPQVRLPIAGQAIDQLGRGVADVEQLADVRLGAAQRLHRRYAPQRVATDVEDDRVPRRGGDLAGELLQAAAAEVRAGVLRRRGH